MLYATQEITVTNTIGTQYLNPYRQDLKKIEAQYASIEDQIRNDPTIVDQQKSELEDLYQRHCATTNYITNRDITLKLFSLNELINQETCTQLLSPSDYEHNLYIACSPIDKEHNSYKKNEHLLAHLAKHTRLISGYIKWAKILSMPTTNIEQLLRTQRVSKELLCNDALRKNLENILQTIKDQNLEDSFLSFWKDETNNKITAYAPYTTNSRFAPLIQLVCNFKSINSNDSAAIKDAFATLDKTTGVISTINWISFIQDASAIMIGIGLLKTSIENIKNCTVAIPHDFSYYGKWSILALPILFPCIKWLANKIVDFSLKTKMQKEFTTFTKLCKKNKISIAQTSTITMDKIELIYSNAIQAEQAKVLATKNMPDYQVKIKNNNTLIITLTRQEERLFRFSHPLMQHKTMVNVILPSILCLLYLKYVANIPLLSWQNVTIPCTKKLLLLPIPGVTLLPWHLSRGLTTTGMVLVDFHQNFWALPKKSIISTTQSNQLARKTLLDFTQLINIVKHLQTILIKNSVLRENLSEIEELDIEKVVLKKVARAQALLYQDESVLQHHGISKKDVYKFAEYLDGIGKELSELLDKLQAHIGQTESNTQYSWFSPTGLAKNIKIRLGSDDLLAAYKIMQSIKDSFAPWLEALGEIDRKVSEVALLKEFEQKNIKFCFAEYKEQLDPYISTTNLWLPHLLSKNNPENIISNSIEIGGCNLATTIILSGLTEGGKSTFERTLATATLMAMTCGIVPATKWVSTTFDRILLSFNATDNLSKDESGFATEVNMLKNIVHQKNTMSPDKKILIIIDELFQKVQSSGEYLSYQVIKENFINRPNILSLIVSHREQPKQLEKEFTNRCQNYHFVPVEINGKIIPTYQIQPGAIFRSYTQITLQEILSNQEDKKNLQLVQEAALIS